MAFFMSQEVCPNLAELTWHLINSHQLESRPLVVALSGGLDSMVVLRVMLELRSHKGISFSAIHVNHGISANAASWQSFVEEFCRINDVDLQTKKLTIKKSAGQSLEQVARDERYQALANLTEANAVILTGHHLLDQAETFFLRLKRGSGANGLSGMSVVAPIPVQQSAGDSRVVLRPLLSVEKAELRDYANYHHLEWVEDDSNQDDAFDRNFLRLQVLPSLTQRWPHFPSAIAQSCEILAEESELLKEYLQQDLEQCKAIKYGLPYLDVDKLTQFSIEKQRALLRLFVNEQCGSPLSRKQLNEIFESVLSSESDKQAFIEIGWFQLRKHKSELYCVPLELVDSRLQSKDLNLEPHKNKLIGNSKLESCLFKEQKLIVEVVNNEDLCEQGQNSLWQFRYGNLSALRFRPNENSGSKRLKEYFKQQGCPAWMRDQVPLLFCDEHLVAVIGFGVDSEWQERVSYNLKPL